MNFELQSLSLSQAANLAADALILLWPDNAVAAKPSQTAADPLSHWVHEVLAAKDLEEGAGQCLPAHRLPGVKARRVVLVRTGDSSAPQVRKAVAAAMGLL